MSMLGTALLALVMQTLPLQGVVVKKGTAEVLSRATVELRRDQQNAGVLDSMTTEDDGRFSFGNVAPGRYRLTVARAGYTRPPLSITLSAGQPGHAVEDIQLNMTPAGSISGRVVDGDGRPMGNVEIKAMKASYPEGKRVLTPVQSVLTDDLGEYRIFWLAPGRYYISAVHSSIQGMSRHMFSLVGATVSGPGGFYSGGKADPALGEFGLRPDMESEGEHFAPIFFGGTTDEQTASGIDLREAADFGSVNLVVRPVQARHVRGVVMDGDTGKPAQYGSISLPKELDGPRMKEVEVDRETGTFDMLLFPGIQTLTATSASGVGYATFTLGDADIDNLIIATTPEFDVAGHITVDGPPLSAAAAAAIGTLHMTLRRDPPRGEPSTTEYSSPLPAGSFSISASAGDFRINIAPLLNVTPIRFASPQWPAIQNVYVKSMRLGSVDVLNAPLHLDRPPSAPLEVVIATNPGALDGQVVGRGSGTVADIPVVLLPDLRQRNELYRSTTTDASGRFHFDRVIPGDYKVFSWEEVDDGVWFDAEFMKTNEGSGIAVRIGEGGTVTVRVEAIP